MFNQIFPKYKPKAYHTGNNPNGNIWTILERRWFFFYKPLTHIKAVQYEVTNHVATSHEILMFGSEEDVESEIDRLDMGYDPIVRRVWRNHKIVEVEYGNRQIKINR